MVECERLRILNEHFSAMNEELGVLRSEDEADFEEKIAQMGCAFRDQLEDAEAAFMRELEETQEKLKNERLKETKSLKKELDSRDAKIKRLEHDLNRQCEINAMFTLNYDRDTNFTKHLSMPLTIPVSETAGTSGLLKSTKFQLSSTRRPLIDLDTNNVTTRKRSRLPDRRGDPTSSEADKSISNNAATVKSPRDDDGLGLTSAPSSVIHLLRQVGSVTPTHPVVLLPDLRLWQAPLIYIDQ
ncbi:hypothetical protein OPQ81_009347 [Rhizoctonia solani]|nr:hypothetical protein OPQ81_009347 [Rhizoctonia solani]